MADSLLEAVRGLWLADPGLGPKPLLAKLREQQPDLGAGNKEVREALTALKAEGVAGGAAASVASLSAFSAVSASRTSLVPAPRFGCCSRSLASSGLGPSSGSASHSPRTASRRLSAMRRRPQRDTATSQVVSPAKLLAFDRLGG